MDRESLFLIASNVKGVGKKTIDYLIDLYDDNLLTASNFKHEVTRLKLTLVIKEKLIGRIRDYTRSKEVIYSYMEKANISLLNVNDIKGEYSLNDIIDKPKYLYIKGTFPVSVKKIAVIGARKCTKYGEKSAYKIAYDLAKEGYVVVSGLAYGIDAAAHRGALDAGGETIAVLGSGVDICYPKANKDLYDSIQKNGCLLSEFRLKEEPSKFTFPIRNRIISGLSSSIIVVEAKEKSGTMITVSYALDQGRQVYAVPGNINSLLSSGTNKLISEGALILRSVDDL